MDGDGFMAFKHKKAAISCLK